MAGGNERGCACESCPANACPSDPLAVYNPDVCAPMLPGRTCPTDCIVCERVYTVTVHAQCYKPDGRHCEVDGTTLFEQLCYQSGSPPHLVCECLWHGVGWSGPGDGATLTCGDGFWRVSVGCFIDGDGVFGYPISFRRPNLGGCTPTGTYVVDTRRQSFRAGSAVLCSRPAKVDLA